LSGGLRRLIWKVQGALRLLSQSREPPDSRPSLGPCECWKEYPLGTGKTPGRPACEPHEGTGSFYQAHEKGPLGALMVGVGIRRDRNQPIDCN